MRISDWSSDVCSSDLQLSRRDLYAERRIVLAPWPPVVALQPPGVALVPVAGRELRDVGAQPHQRFHLRSHPQAAVAVMAPVQRAHADRVARDHRPPARLVPQREGEDAVEPVEPGAWIGVLRIQRSEEHTSELQSLMRISYAVFCL